MALTAKQKRNLRKWVEALESGEYKQARNALKGPRGGYCCLGVWCEVGRRGRWEDGSFVLQPSGLELWSNIREIRDDDLGLTEAEERHYIRKNDRGSRFSTIARQIRKDHPEAFA